MAPLTANPTSTTRPWLPPLTISTPGLYHKSPVVSDQTSYRVSKVSISRHRVSRVSTWKVRVNKVMVTSRYRGSKVMVTSRYRSSKMSTWKVRVSQLTDTCTRS